MKKEKAIKLFGSQANIARLLKISPQAVQQWPDPIPPLRVFQLRDIVNKRNNRWKNNYLKAPVK